MSGLSTADRFIAVMAEIRAMEPEGDDPMRYAIWHLQEQAERALSNAIGAAHSLTNVASILKRDYRKAVEEARAAATEQENKQ